MHVAVAKAEVKIKIKTNKANFRFTKTTKNNMTMIGAADGDNRKTKINTKIIIKTYQNIVLIAKAIAIIRSIAFLPTRKNKPKVSNLNVLPRKHAK